MKLTSRPFGQLLTGMAGATGEYVRLMAPEGRAVDGDEAGPTPVVEVWFVDGVLEGRICWASAEKGNCEQFRDFEDPEQFAPDQAVEK